jgi:predicted RNA-binding Zn-ribbon protein involved in translation (DUF1610 family)
MNCTSCDAELSWTDGAFVACPACNGAPGVPGAAACVLTGVYESSCACESRMAFAAGDPFMSCPLCGHDCVWVLLRYVNAE